MTQKIEYSLAPELVERLAEELQAAGFELDEDFAILYGAGWALTGIRLSGTRLIEANSAAAHILSRTA